MPVRALVGWCLLRRLVYSALRPPTQPTNRQAFAGCFCGLLLRGVAAARAPPRGRPNMAGYFQQPAILWPAPWGARSAGGRPYPAPVVPPHPSICGLLLRAALAGFFCGLLLRIVAAARAPPRGQAPWGARSAGGRPYPAPVVPPRPILCGLLLRAALFTAIMPPDGRLGGSPEAPAPLPLPHGRASAPPCFCGLLWWAALFAAVDGWALSRCRPPFGRPHARSCPLGFSAAHSGKLSLVVKVLARFTRAVRSSVGFCVGF